MPWAREDLALRQDPFPHGHLDDFLPAALYQRLVETFVAPEQDPDLEILGKRKKRLRFNAPPGPKRMTDRSPDWAEYLEFLALDGVQAAALDWLRRLIPLDSLPEGPYRALYALRHELRPDQLVWSCEFSTLDPGVYLPPHSDSTDKLLTFVHHFAPEGWQRDWDGGTQIYTAKDPAQNLNFSNFFLTYDRVTVLDHCAYQPNRLFFFAKTPAAWHGVAPVGPDATLPRRSFNFSLRTHPEATLPPRMAGLIAEIQAQEAAAFAR